MLTKFVRKCVMCAATEKTFLKEKQTIKYTEKNTCNIRQTERKKTEGEAKNVEKGGKKGACQKPNVRESLQNYQRPIKAILEQSINGIEDGFSAPELNFISISALSVSSSNHLQHPPCASKVLLRHPTPLSLRWHECHHTFSFTALMREIAMPEWLVLPILWM